MQVMGQQHELTGGLPTTSAAPSRVWPRRLSSVRSSGISAGSVQLWFGTLVATVCGLGVFGRVTRPNLLWPVSGVAIALALPLWHLGWWKRIRLLLAVGTGFFTAAALLGMPVTLASMIAFWTCLDVAIAATVLAPTVRSFDNLKQQESIFKFLAVVSSVPLVTGLLGAYPVAGFLHQPVLQTAMMNVLENSLGMAIGIPLVLLARGGNWRELARLRTRVWKVGAVVAMFLTSVSLVFWQNSNPFLFMVFPPMILVILLLGLEGAVATSVALSLISWTATMHGHGPVLLAHGSPLHQLLVLQGFCWICIATVLPVGALLDERRHAEHVAKESQAIYRVLLHHAEGVIVLSSRDGRERYVSPGITRMTGWSEQEYQRLDRFDTVHPEDQEAARKAVEQLGLGSLEETVRYRMRVKSGGWKWVEALIRAYGIEGEGMAGYVATVRDISDLREIEENWERERHGLVQEHRKLADLASTDPLTGLLNRRGFDDRVQILRQRRGIPLAILMVDIDYFKRFNDTYGHAAGDKCLVQVAGVLQAHATRGDDLVARLGGEEFAVILPGATLPAAIILAEKMAADLRSLAIQHANSPFHIVTMSLGAAAETADENGDVARLLEHADSALYLSKRKRNCVSAHSEPDPCVMA